jgi:hypothetical protein
LGRIRTIKPEFPQSESMGRISREARLCFILLWTIVDDAGRTRANSRMLASLLYPYDGDIAKKVDGWLTELASEKCLVLYERDGNKYLEVCKWLEHQKIDRPSKARIPGIDEHSRVLDESSTTDQRTKGPKDGTSTEGSASALLPLPEFLPAAKWDEFDALRRAMQKKAPWTEGAKRGVLAKTQKAWDDGLDVIHLLDEAIVSGWRTIYPKADSPKRKVEYRPATPEDNPWGDL